MVNYKERGTNSLTNSISYCQHTNIKIAVSTHFHNYSGINTRGEHPIFNATAHQLEDMILRSEQLRLTTTEQYLVCTAYLVNAGIVDTTKCGLHLDSNKFHDSKMIILLPKLFRLLRQHVSNPKLMPSDDDHAALPTYAVSPDNQCDGAQLKVFLSGLIKLLEQYYTFDGIMHKQDNSSEAEQLLKQELIKIENGYNDALPTKIIKKKFLNLATDSASKEQIAIIRKTLFTTRYADYKESDYKLIAEWIIENVDTLNMEKYEHIKRLIIRYYDYAVSVINDISLDVSFDITPPANKPTTTTINSIDKASKGSALAALSKFKKPKLTYI